MSLLAALVPVLTAPGDDGGIPVVSERLHGRALFVHAAASAVAAFADRAVVSSPFGGAPSVAASLATADLAGVQVFDGGDTLGEVITTLLTARPGRSRDTARVLLVHDPLCPLVPSAFLSSMLERALAEPGVVHAATRPMTDTVKSVVDGVVSSTVDRDLLRVLSSPLVLPVGLLRDLVDDGSLAGCADPVALVERARTVGAPVHWAPAPAIGRRVGTAAAVSVLECLTEVRAAG